MCQTSGRKNCQNKKGRKTNCKSNKTIGKGPNKKAFYAASFVPKKKAASAVSRISQRKVFQGPQQVALRQRRNTFLHFNFVANVDDTLERIENVTNLKNAMSNRYPQRQLLQEYLKRRNSEKPGGKTPYPRNENGKIIRPTKATTGQNYGK